MDIILLALGFLLAFYVAWSIGANDETMAALAGSGFVTVFVAALLGSIMDFAGAVFLGHSVEKTIGKGLLAKPATMVDAVIILLAVATWLVVASYRGWPVSTTHSAVGAAIGLGLYKYGIGGVVWDSLTRVVAGWVISPLTGLLGALLMYIVSKRIVANYVKGLKDVIRLSKISSVFLLIFSMTTAFFRGANDIANASAFLSSILGQPFLVRGVCGLGMALGLIILGRRVIKSVGVQLVELDPFTALCVQASVTATMSVGTILGLPLSGTHVLVSAVLGIGVARRTWINVKGVKDVILTWILTFPCSAILAVVFAYLWNIVV